MFQSVNDAKNYRSALRGHRVGAHADPRAYARKLAKTSPFDAFHYNMGARTGLLDGFTPLNDTEIQAIAHASCTTPVATCVSIVLSSFFEKVTLIRTGRPVALTSEFETHVQETFGALAREVAKQLLLYGIAAVVLAPPESHKRDREGRARGTRALERASFQAGRSGAVDPKTKLSTPVCIDLADTTAVLELGVFDAVREYRLSSDQLSDQARESLMVSVAHAPTAGGHLTAPTVSLLSRVASLGFTESLVLSTLESQAFPTSLIQERHGPSNSRESGGGGLNPSSMFFDQESTDVLRENEQNRGESLIDLVKRLNDYQTREQPPKVVGDKQIKEPEPRFFMVPPGNSVRTIPLLPFLD